MTTEFSDQDLDELQDFLLENMESRAMPLDVAHGYLTSVLSGPRMIMPGEWLPVILGDSEFKDELKSERMYALLMIFYNSVLDELEAAQYDPLIINKPMENGDPLPLPYGWCEGYILGMKAHGEEALELMTKDEEAADHLAPVVAFMMYEESQLLDPPDEQEHRAAAEQLGISAIGLYQWWLPRRNQM